jgi:hypothetical protein
MAQGFDTWMKRVDSALVRKCGLTSDDLSDCCYYDWYEDGVSPINAANMVLETNGF